MDFIDGLRDRQEYLAADTIEELREIAKELAEALDSLMKMRDQCFIPNDGDWWDDSANAALTRYKSIIGE